MRNTGHIHSLLYLTSLPYGPKTVMPYSCYIRAVFMLLIPPLWPLSYDEL